MHKYMIAIILTMITVVFAGEKPTQANSAVKPKPTLIFFMNPNGSPCQMQDQILVQGKANIEKYAQVRYVKTTIPGDREVFYQFGVRSLPSLILMDATGKEQRRFTPGIQPIDVIMNVLTGK